MTSVSEVKYDNLSLIGSASAARASSDNDNSAQHASALSMSAGVSTKASRRAVTQPHDAAIQLRFLESQNRYKCVCKLLSIRRRIQKWRACLVNIIRYHISFMRCFDDIMVLRSDENDK